MKKAIALVLCLALVYALAPAVMAEADLTGTWYIGSATTNGEPIQVVDPEVITITLNEDKTYHMTVKMMSLLTQEGTWEATDTEVTLNPPEGDESAAAVTYAIVDGEMEYMQGNTLLRLSRTPAEAYQLPEIVKAESVDAFNGTWVPKAQLTFGLLGPLGESEAMAFSPFRIEDGKLTPITTEENMSTAYPTEVTLTDGVLTAADDYSTTAISLREDGSLFFEYSGLLTFTIVYEKEAAEEAAPAV